MKREQASSTSDEILVLQAQHGDGEALDELVKRYQHRVYAHCITLLRDEELAWDAVQETFFTMLRRLPELHHACAFPVWLFRLATARVRDVQRSDGRFHRLMQRRSDEPPVAAMDSPAPHRLQLADCLRLLDPEERELIRLRYVENFSTSEAAAILDIPEGTVKSRLHAIRTHLRNLTGEE
jgi:RNA polymerase sigma factor (sigma-70 family)